MSGLVSYDLESSDEDQKEEEETVVTPSAKNQSMALVNAAPFVDATMVPARRKNVLDLDNCKELSYNPRYNELYAPKIGPVDPKKPAEPFKKNFLTGLLEPTNMADTTFEEQRKAHHAWQLANTKIYSKPEAPGSEDKVSIMNFIQTVYNKSYNLYYRQMNPTTTRRNVNDW